VSSARDEETRAGDRVGGLRGSKHGNRDAEGDSASPARGDHEPILAIDRNGV
jgi:hypothetical protein